MADNEKIINPRVSLFLYSEGKPLGEVFSFVGGAESQQYKDMINAGWTDSPARLTLPTETLGLTETEAARADPTYLKSILEGFGFIVLTPEQLSSEVNKFLDVHIDIEQFTDEALSAERERRNSLVGWIDPPARDGREEFARDGREEFARDGREEFINTTAISDSYDELLRRFTEDPTALTKEEHIILGKSLGVNLRINFTEETMIRKINEHLAQAGN